MAIYLGQKFGKWTVVEIGQPEKHRKHLCRCECGIEKHVLQDNLTRGLSTSCGCAFNPGRFRKTHGDRRTRLYNIWTKIKQRCTNERDEHFKFYGKRGITICDEWGSSFTAFRDWSVANGYAPNLVIDRIDTNGNYGPSNCRWTTQKVNMNNQRTNHIVTVFNETKTLAQWAEDPRCKVGYGTLWYRIKSGWLPECAMTKSLR